MNQIASTLLKNQSIENIQQKEAPTNIPVNTYATVATGRPIDEAPSGTGRSWFTLIPISNRARASHCIKGRKREKINILCDNRDACVGQPEGLNKRIHQLKPLLEWPKRGKLVRIKEFVDRKFRTWIMENRRLIIIFNKTAITRTCMIVV